MTSNHFIPCSSCCVSHGRCLGLNQCSVFVVSAQLAFNKTSPVSSTRDQTTCKPGLATCFLLQQTLLTAGRYRAFRGEQSNQSTFRTKAPVQLSSEICSLGQLPKGLHQLRFVLALGTSKVGDVLRREICLPRKKSPWEERRDSCLWNGCGAVLWMEGRSWTCIFYSSTFYARPSLEISRCYKSPGERPASPFLPAGDYSVSISCASPSSGHKPSLGISVFFGWISPENPILRLPSNC